MTAEIAGQAELAAFLAEHSLERLVALAEVDITDLRDAAAPADRRRERRRCVWGERLGHGERGPEALRALRDLALLLGLDAADGLGADRDPGGGQRARPARGGLPARPRARLRRAPSGHERRAGARRRAGRRGEGLLSAALGPDARPSRQGSSGTRRSGAAVRGRPRAVPRPSRLERHADVVFPAEAYPEKEGTVTHPDGRLQRLRPAVGHPGEVRSEWQRAGRARPAGSASTSTRHVSAGAVLRRDRRARPPYTAA